MVTAHVDEYLYKELFKNTIMFIVEESTTFNRYSKPREKKLNENQKYEAIINKAP